MSDRPFPPSTQQEIAGRCERIIDLRDEGWTFQRIGAELGVTAARAAKLHQLAIRRRRRAKWRRSIPLSPIWASARSHLCPRALERSRDRKP
jgi:hypothetical protein